MSRLSDLPPAERNAALLARHRGRQEAYRRANGQRGWRMRIRALLPRVTHGRAFGTLNDDRDGMGAFLAIEWLGRALVIEALRARR